MQGVELGRILAGHAHEPVVYFVRHGPVVKIGTTTKLRSRLSSMYLRMEDVLLVVPGGRETELIFHERFRSLQIAEPHRKELFRLDGDLAAFLGHAIVPAPEPAPAPVHDDGLMGLAEATASGVLRVSLAVARQARYRDQGFPSPSGRHGAIHLYDPDELREWERTRPRALAREGMR